ncbi:uncharacterized protein LOC142580174 [Dermacentor variabilis]|uniref:uncharacterized protein LOC142580174 n=1 Tax=Dermacentor variabilis TaxID=34621 RepID=UPI003F5B6DF3
MYLDNPGHGDCISMGAKCKNTRVLGFRCRLKNPSSMSNCQRRCQCHSQRCHSNHSCFHSNNRTWLPMLFLQKTPARCTLPKEQWTWLLSCPKDFLFCKEATKLWWLIPNLRNRSLRGAV